VRTGVPGSAFTANGIGAGFGNCRSIALNPGDGTEAYLVTTNGNVLRSVNTGGAWVDVTGDLAAAGGTNARCVTVFRNGAAATAGIAIVVGTDSGVFVTYSGGPAATTPGTWRRLGAGFPNTICGDLDWDQADQVLSAGTLGRGAWANAAVIDVSPPTVTCNVQRKFLWPATRGLNDVGLQVTITDDDPSPLRELRVTSDEADALVPPYTPDGQVVLAPSRLRLRAERIVAPGASGRVYLIQVRATDNAANVGSVCCAAGVPVNLTVAHLTALAMDMATAEANWGVAGTELPFPIVPVGPGYVPYP
jgi:hypothetical protein